jgi:hypothetical protein
MAGGARRVPGAFGHRFLRSLVRGQRARPL